MISALTAALIRLRTGVPGQRLPPAASGAVIRAAGLATQILVLILMGRLLSKDVFGDAILVFTIYRLLSYAVGSGLGSLLLYHVARRVDDTALDLRLNRSITLAAWLIAGAISIICFGLSQVIARLFDKPGMETWLMHMAPLILFGALLQVTASSLDARNKVTRSICVTELAPNLLRLVGMGGVSFLDLPQIAVAWVFWVAVALPWLFDAARLFHPTSGMERLRMKDARYASWLAVYPLLGMQLQGIDMLIAGLLFSSAGVAEYAIASRLATLYPFLQQMVVRVFTPRSGALFQRNDIETINRELTKLRRLSLISTASMAASILIGAPLIILSMGNYLESLILLVILAIPPLVRSNFAGIEVVLKMRGNGQTLAMIAAATLLIMVVGAWTMHPVFGSYAIPISMFMSAIFINPLVSWRIGLGGIRIADWKPIPLIAVASVTLIGLTWLFPPTTAAVLGGLCMAVVAVIASVRPHSK